MSKIGQYIRIPLKVEKDPRLNDTDQIVFGYLLSLSQLKGYCFASNNSLVRYIGRSQSSILRSLAKLDSLGYVRKEITSGGRKIFIEYSIYKDQNKEDMLSKLDKEFLTNDNHNYSILKKEEKDSLDIEDSNSFNKIESIAELKKNLGSMSSFEKTIFPYQITEDVFRGRFSRYYSEQITDLLGKEIETYTLKEKRTALQLILKLGYVNWIASIVERREEELISRNSTDATWMSWNQSSYQMRKSRFLDLLSSLVKEAS